jgi:hypothetical protein
MKKLIKELIEGTFTAVHIFLFILAILASIAFLDKVNAEIKVDTVYSPGGTQTCWSYPDGKVVCF